MFVAKPYVHQEYPKWVDGEIVDAPHEDADFLELNAGGAGEGDGGAPPPGGDAPEADEPPRRKGGWPAGKPRKPRED